MDFPIVERVFNRWLGPLAPHLSLAVFMIARPRPAVPPDRHYTCTVVIPARNEADVMAAERHGLAAPMVDRLRLTDKVIETMAESCEQVAALPDPTGEITNVRRRPTGISVGQMRVPIGVFGMIYESRPNVTIEAASLSIKSGNAAILRGGKECFHTNTALAALITALVNDLVFNDLVFHGLVFHRLFGHLIQALVADAVDDLACAVHGVVGIVSGRLLGHGLLEDLVIRHLVAPILRGDLFGILSRAFAIAHADFF